MRRALSDGDIDLLFDNWLNANFDRIEVVSRGDHSHTAVIRSRTTGRTGQERAALKSERDRIAGRIAGTVKNNLFEVFSQTFWDTMLPNGVVMRDATGKDLQHLSGWAGVLAKRLKPNEKAIKKFTTRQCFDLSQQLCK